MSTVINGATKQITHTASTGVFTIVDGNANAISHVVSAGGLLGLGALASSLASTTAALSQSHLSTYDGNLQTAKIADYVKFANLLHSAGTVSSGQLTTILAALIAGWSNVTSGISSLGSSIVRLAP